MTPEQERRLAQISDRREAAAEHFRVILERVIEEWDHDSSWPYDSEGCKYPDEDEECICPGFDEFLAFVGGAPADIGWLMDMLRATLAEVQRPQELYSGVLDQLHAMKEERDKAHIDLDRIRAGARQWLRQDNPVAHLRNCAVTPRAKRLDDAARTACRIGLGQICTCGLAAFCASLEDKEGSEG